MQTRDRFFDDLARVATSAAGLANGLRQEVDTIVSDQMTRVIDRLELVSREEFEELKRLAIEN